MLQRLDFLTKFYIRTVAALWILFVPALYLISLFLGSENTSFNLFLNSLFEWTVLIPFGLEQSIPENIAPLIRFFFWSFWILTITRWVITGKHFYQ